MNVLRSVFGVIATVAIVIAVTGADSVQVWTAAKLRGGVELLVDGEWVALKRGGIIGDGQYVRTGKNGFVEFQRGQETVSLSPDTVVQIEDKLGEQYTTVKASTGEVSVVADVKNVVHFEVRTPYISAVVKGTVFTVTTGKSGSSVAVQRGKVAVEDVHTHQHTVISKGQTASTDKSGSMSVMGVAAKTASNEDAGLGSAEDAALDKGSLASSLKSANASSVGASASANAGGSGKSNAGGNAGANAGGNGKSSAGK